MNITSTLNDLEQTNALASAFKGVTICRKGKSDVISNGTEHMSCQIDGSPRRCGGQGDVLSGSICAFAHWFDCSRGRMQEEGINPMINAAFAGCLLTRECSFNAYQKHGRGMVTENMIDEISATFSKIF